jgi:hypothetical protein
MKNTSRTLILLAVLNTAAFVAICRLFDSDFANSTIDWFSFGAGGFLAIEGIYKIVKFRTDSVLLQISRIFRILIGANIFTIHLIQFIWGINAEVLDTPLRQAAIDWSAFSSGVFLMAEAIYRIFTARNAVLRDQVLRGVRMVIGSCVFTIHLLQFMR